VKAFARAADADLAALLQGELFQVVERYERLKQRLGQLDFVDLLIRARDLIRDSVAVRGDFQQRLTPIFVDEFLDTDPLQAEILLLLASGGYCPGTVPSGDPVVQTWRDISPAPGKLFIVGDPKQSIYRFRRASVWRVNGERLDERIDG
jgi:ATP-dependent exoDNAse (exonuclease V) beta subunit